jgi:hypothetical protein
VARELEKKRTELALLDQCTDEASDISRNILLAEMDKQLHREEILWQQRSRIDWMRAGDRNTSFFHRKATLRQNKNKIRKLKRPDGPFTNDVAEMEDMASAFFQDLYTRDDVVEPDIILETMQPCVDEHMNEKLTAPFTEKEISDALFQIGPLKAPGPDGFPARFLQRNWGILKEDVIAAVQNFFC